MTYLTSTFFQNHFSSITPKKNTLIIDSFELGTWAPSHDLVDACLVGTQLSQGKLLGKTEVGRTTEVGAMLRIDRRGATPRVSRGEVCSFNSQRQPRVKEVSCVIESLKDWLPGDIAVVIEPLAERVLNQRGFVNGVPPVTDDGIVWVACRQHGEESMSIQVVEVVVRRTIP
jgi:hypothetical protein